MSKSRAIGTRHETDFVNYLNDDSEGFYEAERRALAGALDKGDVAGVPGWAFECKNEKNITLARYMDELNAETVNARAAFGAAVVKRRGKNIQDAYVVMPLWMFRKLLNTLYRLGWKP